MKHTPVILHSGDVEIERAFFGLNGPGRDDENPDREVPEGWYRIEWPECVTFEHFTNDAHVYGPFEAFEEARSGTGEPGFNLHNASKHRVGNPGSGCLNPDA